MVLAAGLIYLKVSKGVKKVFNPYDKQSNEVEQKLGDYEERSKSIGLLLLLVGAITLFGFIKSYLNF